MGKCVVKECSSRSQRHNRASGVTFHSIPKDPDRQEKWIKNIRLLRKETDWLPTKSTIICSHHFKKDHKRFPTSDKGRVHLTDDAVPVYEDYNYKRYLCENIEPDDEIEKLTEFLKLQIMKKKIKRLETVTTGRLSRIKSLEQKNRRLIARNKYLKDVIMEMKKKLCNVKIKPQMRWCIRNSKSASTEEEIEQREEE